MELLISTSQLSIHKYEISRLTIARFALSSSVLPMVTSAMPFAETFRFAASSNRAGNSFSKAFIGKERDAETGKWRPLKNHEHAHFLATDEDGDGRLDYLTVYAPCGFNADDLRALEQIRAVKRPKNLPSIKVVLVGLGSKENFADIPVFRKSKIWRSQTPFSLPRFPNRGGGKPPRPRDLPEAQLIKELENRGLPAPVNVKLIKGYFENRAAIAEIETQVPRFRWLEFHATRLRKEMSGKGLCGFEIEFAEEISGAISLGFGSHFGLGLFLPVI